jgi:hypothetical protein
LYMPPALSVAQAVPINFMKPARQISGLQTTVRHYLSGTDGSYRFP